MKFAKYWAKATEECQRQDGSVAKVTCRGWSQETIAQAIEMAKSRARKLAAHLVNDNFPDHSYSYGARPLPEPIISHHDSTDGEAVVTRNCYGALILNVSNVAIIDIDGSESSPGFFGKLFGAKPASVVPKTITDAMQGLSGFSARLYQTPNGHRLIVTSKMYSAASKESESLLIRFNADSKYTTLCRLQECYRARLTPKPWRIDLSAPPASFPFGSAEEEEEFLEWERSYATKSSGFAACKFLEELGSSMKDSRIAPVVQLHDEMSGALSGRPLA